MATSCISSFRLHGKLDFVPLVELAAHRRSGICMTSKAL